MAGSVGALRVSSPPAAGCTLGWPRPRGTAWCWGPYTPVLGSLHPIPSLPALGAPSFGVQERELSRPHSITRSRAGALQKQGQWQQCSAKHGEVRG